MSPEPKKSVDLVQLAGLILLAIVLLGIFLRN